MKKYLFPALALGLVMTSCQSDEPFAPGEGGEKQVTFTLNLPGEMGTRANEGYNSGKGGITNLINQQINYTLVLEANGDKRVFTNVDATNVTKTTATFSPTVVLGRNYKVTAYATFDAEPVDVTEIAVSKSFNDESKDTYFKTVTHDFSTGELATLDLRRPFGKLRLVATDYKAGGTALNTEIESVKVTYHDQQTATFNAVEGLFSYNGVNGDIEATKPFEGYYSSTADETTLFADYIPANSQDNMVDFTVEVKYTGSAETYYRRFNDIPVRRNSLTTLKGNFFTAGATINVTVDDNFEEQNLFEKTVTVTTAAELTNAIANAVDNELIIFGGDINGNVTAVQRDGIDVTIDGKGFKYDGTIYLNGQSRNNGLETLTIQNVKFETSTNRDFISGETTDNTRYAHNVIVRNCSFVSNITTGTNNVVAMRYRQTYNMKVEDCVANNLFLLVWATGGNGITIDGVTVNNPTGEGGVSIAKDKNVVIKNSTINAAGGYGIRAGGESATSYTESNLSVENTTINAKQPIVVRYVVGNHKVALSGADLITNELYHVIFTKGNNNATYVAPEAGAFTISGAEDYNVYPREIVVRTEEQLVSALNGLTTFNTLVKLIDDITITTDWDNRYRGAKISVPFRIDGQGHTLKFTGALTDPNYSSVFRFENDAEVKNLKIDLSEINARCRAISAKQNLVIDQCEFIGNANYNTRGIIYGEGQTNSQFDASITITNSKFTNWKRGLTDNENAKDVKNVVVKGTIFSNAPVYISAYETITFVNNTMDNTWVNITSYTSPETLKVNAVGNSLDKDYSQYNVIGSSSKKFSATNVEAQNGFTVFYAE